MQFLLNRLRVGFNFSVVVEESVFTAKHIVFEVGRIQLMLRARLIRTLAIASICSLVAAGTARAALIFPRLVSAFGGAVDSADHSGSIGIAGQFSSSSVNIVLTYEDSDDPGDGITCTFKNLGDLSIGVGILTLTVAASDSCFQTTTPSNSVSNAGKSISFYYFPGSAVNAGSRIVGKSINLVDSDANTIEDQTVVGTIQP